MSKLNLIVDSFDLPSDIQWRLDESTDKSVVDGVNILARLVGPMFLVNGESRNKRFYSKNLWEKSINECNSRISSGGMIGTIGHEQVIDDKALLEGKISHKITKLWIDESGGVGMGEIQVLGTSAGKELNALIRGGIKLPVSSRASGEYRGTTSTGAKIIDENSFQLSGFDFVQLPGVPSAIPLLVESESESNSDTILIKDENHMSQELLESITREKMKLQESLEEALAKVSTISNENSALRLAIDSKKKEVTNFEESSKTSAEKLAVLEAELQKSKDLIATYEALGTPGVIKEAIDAADKMISEYKEFGTVDELTSAFTRIETVVEDMGKLGTPDEIQKVLETLGNYVTYGTPTSISEQVQLLLQYEELGTPEQLTKIIDVTEKYAVLGSPEEINHAFELTESTVNKIKLEEKANVAKKIASDNEVELSIVESLLQKHSPEEATKLIKSLKSNDPSNRYRRETTNESTAKEVIVEETKIDENNSMAGDTRGSRLMKMFSQ